MIDVPVSIEADVPLDEAVSALAGDGSHHVIVTDEGTVEGLLADHDIIRSRAILPNTGAVGAVPVQASPADSDLYDTQSVCELCGSLSRDLADHNGQLVCPSCLPV